MITILTFLVFLGICWWAFRPANRRRFRNDALIPFEGSEERPIAREGDEPNTNADGSEGERS